VLSGCGLRERYGSAGWSGVGAWFFFPPFFFVFVCVALFACPGIRVRGQGQGPLIRAFLLTLGSGEPHPGAYV
jgi:hypothetical protein